MNLLQNQKIKHWDWLLIIGTILAPMTNLRIWKVGPAEILCLIWAMRYIRFKKINITYVSKFFLLFFSAMIIGALICLMIVPKELRIVDFFTWAYLFIVATVTYQHFSMQNYCYCTKILRTITIIATIWYSVLYIYSMVFSRHILGIQLWYSRYRFAGGGNNPHQLAAFNCALIFCFFVDLLKNERRLISIIGIIANFVILVATKSSTGYMSVAIGFLFLIVCVVMHSTSSRRKRITAFTILIASIVIIIILFHDKLYYYIYSWIISDDNGIGRFQLFSHIGVTFSQSPIFGLGPGVHSIDYMEYHNSYLEILAAGGIVGIVALFQMTISLLKKVRQEMAFLPVIVTLYAYGIAGFVFRRLVFWVIIVLISTIADKAEMN